MWLKLKILLGYVILLLLLVLTIHIFRKEQTRRNSLRQDEHELACIRHLAGETYAGLLGLATYGETASVWDESDLGLYHTKKDSVCNMLQTLKRYVKSPEQQSRIDSLCLLLERKELLLDTVMDTFGRLRKTGEIVNRRMSFLPRKRRRRKLRRRVSGHSSGPGGKNRPICSRRNSWNASDSPLVNIRVPHLSRACCTPLTGR